MTRQQSVFKGREESPNDPKLSDRGVRRGTCVVGGKAAAEAGAVTHGAVRCSAWLAVAVISRETFIVTVSLVAVSLLAAPVWKWVRRSREPAQALLAVGLLTTATAVVSLGLRLVVWMEASERRLRELELVASYWKQSVNEERAKQGGQR